MNSLISVISVMRSGIGAKNTVQEPDLKNFPVFFPVTRELCQRTRFRSIYPRILTNRRRWIQALLPDEDEAVGPPVED
jgi:hypothetical protein